MDFGPRFSDSDFEAPMRRPQMSSNPRLYSESQMTQSNPRPGVWGWLKRLLFMAILVGLSMFLGDRLDVFGRKAALYESREESTERLMAIIELNSELRLQKMEADLYKKIADIRFDVDRNRRAAYGRRTSYGSLGNQTDYEQ